MRLFSAGTLGGYPELDLEAARIACVADGDAGGEELIKAGFPKNRILSLGVLVLENLLDPARYTEVVGSLIQELSPNTSLPVLPDFKAINDPWPKALED